MIEGDAVGGDENSGTVLTEFAMNENFLRRSLAEKREEFGELSGGGGRESTDRNGDKVNAERMRLRPFPLTGAGRFTAQIDDGGDAEFLEFSEIGKMRLRATKKRVRNFSSVRNSRKRDFRGEGRRGRGRRGGESGRLPKWDGGKEQWKEESEEERKKSHRELARKSLGGIEEKKKEKAGKVECATAPQDIGV